MADVTVVSKDVRLLPGAQSFRKTAGAALAVGALAYIASDGDVEGADADAAASSIAVGIVISAPNGVLTCVAGDMLDIAGPGCRVTGFSGLTPGTLVYASTTAGAIADARPAGSSGDYVWVCGLALDATTILVMAFTDNFAAA
jgi:hypothetical protein